MKPLKHYYLVTIIFSLISATSFAQDGQSDKNAKISIMGGVNLATINEESASNITAFYAGIAKEIKLVPLLRFQTGLLYVRNGANLNNSTFTIDYLQVPALLKIKLGPAYVMTGFTGSVRVGGKVETDGVTEELDSDVFSGFDYGTQFGAGFNFLIFGIEARYNWGLSEIVKKGFGIDYNHRYFELGLKIRLPF